MRLPRIGKATSRKSAYSKIYMHRLLLQYCEGKKDKLELAKKGTGNAIAEIKPLLKDDQAMYGYARIVRFEPEGAWATS